tara:strand:- start:32768 stop:33982 length:1215 start_codon:yes stop_codon:yes gene_type:complete
MKILILSQYFWPESFRINEVAQTLNEMGHEIDILTAKPNYPKGKLFQGYNPFSFEMHLYKNMKVYRAPIITRGLNNPVKLTLNYLSFVITGSLYVLFKLKNNDYQIIYIYSTSPVLQAIPGLIIRKLRKIPLVLNLQDLWPDSLSATGYIKNKYTLRFVDLIVKFIYKNCDLILVSSKPFIKKLEKYNLKFPIKYFPNSVDPIFYSKKKIKQKTITELKDGFNIVFAGNLGKAQSIDTIIGLSKALIPYEEIKLIIFGDGSEYKYLKSKKLQNNLKNIYLMGRYPLIEMPNIFYQADILLATLSNQDCFDNTLPNKIQAYMSAKKPIVVSMNGEGARIINESKSGIAVPAENITKLKDAIIKIYKLNPLERKKISENSFKYFKKNFYHPTLIKKLEKELQSLIL